MDPNEIYEDENDYLHSEKGWLNSAGFSLAKLGQVKTNVYNIGAADPKTLKATKTRLLSNGHASVLVAGHQELSLSNVVSQRNAWGSSGSIPELMRQQRQRGRPGSATAKQRPGSGHPRPPDGVHPRRRPHSAKVPGHSLAADEGYVQVCVEISDDFDEGESVLGVAGARYTPGSRPDNMSYTPGGVGYAAPLTSAHERTQREVRNTVRQFLSSQTGGNIQEGSVPPVPRSSPDAQQLLDSHTDELISGASANETTTQQLNLTMTLPNPDDEDFDPDELPQQPHIHYTQIHSNIEVPPSNQPSNGFHNGHEHFNIGADHSSTDLNGQTSLDGSSLGNCDNHPNNLQENTNGIHGHIEIESDRWVALSDRPMPSDILSQKQKHQTASLRKPRPHSAKASVRINESENVTVDITPRSATVRSRPGSGRRDLRYVKSRIDSGIKMYPTRPTDKKPRPASASNARGESHASSAHKPPRPSSAKVATLNVEYIDTSDTEGQGDGNGVNLAPSLAVSGKAPRKSDVVTVMSELRFSQDNQSAPGSHLNAASTESQGQGDCERPGSRLASETKIVSAGEKNYYEIAMGVHRTRTESAKNGDVGQPASDLTVTSSKQVKKTVKTLELVDGREVKETKDVSVIEAQEHESKEYVAPRPASAVRSKRSISAKSAEEQKEETPTAPKDPPQNATRPTHDSQGRRIHKPQRPKSAQPQPVHSQPVQVTDSEVWLENVEERPGSRMGFHVQEIVSNKENLIDISATPHAKTCDSVSRPQVKSRPHSAHTPSTHCSHRMSKDMKPATPVTRKHSKTDSVAAIFASERNYKSYGNYAGAAAHNREINKRYGKDSKPADVIEIWTRKEDFEYETEGVKECREIQDRLTENGVPVSLQTITRALLPPTEYGWVGPSYKSTMRPSRHPFSSNLLTKPETWLPEEHKRLKEAEKKVREATAQLQAQEREERRQAMSASGAGGKKKGKKSGKKKSKRPKSSS